MTLTRCQLGEGLRLPCDTPVRAPVGAQQLAAVPLSDLLQPPSPSGMQLPTMYCTSSCSAIQQSSPHWESSLAAMQSRSAVGIVIEMEKGRRVPLLASGSYMWRQRGQLWLGACHGRSRKRRGASIPAMAEMGERASALQSQTLPDAESAPTAAQLLI
ncbi:hypothetical protein BV25DRAFT_1832467, partial [Artomyces pyxidatus]